MLPCRLTLMMSFRLLPFSIPFSVRPVTIVERITACRDPTDDKFLELAVNGRADMIVTGDLDLLVLSPFRVSRSPRPVCT